MSKNNLEDSKLWQQSIAVLKATEQVVPTLPHTEAYTFGDAMHRMAVTTTSDIAMAVGKDTKDKDSLFDYRYARGHLFTLKGLLLVAQELGYTPDDYGLLLEIESLSRSLTKLINELISENEEKA